jgi:hypothetical protein
MKPLASPVFEYRLFGGAHYSAAWCSALWPRRFKIRPRRSSGCCWQVPYSALECLSWRTDGSPVALSSE